LAPDDEDDSPNTSKFCPFQTDTSCSTGSAAPRANASLVARSFAGISEGSCRKLR
jgi:hypothetical protein